MKEGRNEAVTNLITTVYGIASDSAGSTKLRSAPLEFEYAGFYYYGTGSMDVVGSYGYYWSRSAYSETSTYYLGFGDNNVGPQDNDHRGYGYTLRCIAQ